MVFCAKTIICAKPVTTTKKNGAIINNIYNYGTGTPSVKFGFIRTAWIVFWMTVLVVGTYMILTNPDIVTDGIGWLRNLFS